MFLLISISLLLQDHEKQWDIIIIWRQLGWEICFISPYSKENKNISNPKINMTVNNWKHFCSKTKTSYRKLNEIWTKNQLESEVMNLLRMESHCLLLYPYFFYLTDFVWVHKQRVIYIHHNFSLWIILSYHHL